MDTVSYWRCGTAVWSGYWDKGGGTEHATLSGERDDILKVNVNHCVSSIVLPQLNALFHSLNNYFINNYHQNYF